MSIPLKPQCALIIGASSGMGAALARLLATQGFQLALAARREERLQAIAETFNAGEKPRVHVYPHDVTQYDSVPELFDQAVETMGGLTHVFYVAGVMPKVEIDEFNFEKDRQMVETNLLGMMAWLNQAADFFTRIGEGVIVGVGSVAGDRGRPGQPGYNTSKGAQAIFLESLRNRLDARGVRVVTIKPGPVETEMTQGLGKLPFQISAEAAAKAIAKAAKRGRGTVYVPFVWRPIMTIIRHIPSFIMRKAGGQ